VAAVFADQPPVTKDGHWAELVIDYAIRTTNFFLRHFRCHSLVPSGRAARSVLASDMPTSGSCVNLTGANLDGLSGIPPIAKVPKREFMYRGINQHTLEKIYREEEVRVSRLAKVLKALQQWESEPEDKPR